jgi:hypothetical protein
VSKIKIESTTGEQIQMFEFQALSSGTNVALNKTAAQSSTFKSKYASLALDGDTTTFSHTDDPSPWWQVDLGGTFAAEFVKIKNRWCGNESDDIGCLCRLSNAKISYLTAAGGVISTTTIGNTCGVQELSFDLSTCASTSSITISDAVVTEDESFSVKFNNPMSGTTIYAAVVENSACSTTNANFEVKSTTQNNKSGYTSVTLSHNIKSLISAEQRNSGTIKLEFCLRADVWHASYSSSLLASKVTVGITVTFDNSQNFQVDMQASDFASAYSGYTSERGVDLTAALGKCSAPGNEGPYAVGSTLKFCLRSLDTDAVIAGLKDVSFTDSMGNNILGIVDTSGQPSFISAINGINSRSVDVSTMMASTIYDQGYAGDVITVRGTVLVSYITAGRRRQLRHTIEQEQQPFSLLISVADETDDDSTESKNAWETFTAHFDSSTFQLAGGVATIFAAVLVYTSRSRAKGPMQQELRELTRGRRWTQ